MGLLEKEPERLVKELALYSDVPIEPGRTLIIFDEIQECEDRGYKSHESIYCLIFSAILCKTAVFFRQFSYICLSET